MNDETIFHAALALPPEKRNAYLDQTCGGDAALRRQVEILLNAHENPGSFLAKPAVNLPEESLPETIPDVPTEQVGTMIAGRFKLLEKIAEGGMGTVWVAEQMLPIRRKVALKLIKPGMDSKSVLARFEAERQALALMDHPNIARVLDGGTSESGRPFFVMEYVKGISLTKYCNEVRLSIPERLALFVPICHAVQHAHQKGIIHRDLKPSNILVCLYDGNPVPKVIDFGLAKALHQPLAEHTLHTAHGLMIGTPLYMSPEQAEINNLDVDTRTDIYSLGVILYELLTGTTPLERKQFKEAAYQEMLRLIKEVEPPKPSDRLSGSGTLPSLAAQRKLDPVKLTKLVRGELDWIVMKALEKNRGRRYETANGFARDIQAYLADEAVEACPPSAGYRLQKFARKHRAALTTAATILILLVAGVAVSTWQAIRATQAEEDAAKDRDKALKAKAQAKEQEEEAMKQAKIAKENEVKAKEAVGEKDVALKDLKYNLALDQILLSQTSFESGNVILARERLEQVPPDLRNWEWRFLARQYNGGIFTLYGHTGNVSCVAFSPDGTRFGTGSSDGIAKVWDARTGTPLLDFKGHTQNVKCLAFSPDGSQLVTGGADKTAKVWDARTGRPLLELKGLTASVFTVAYSPDGSRLVTGCLDKTAKVWDVRTGTPLLELKGLTGPVFSVAYSPDGSRLVTASRVASVKVWDARTGTLLLELNRFAAGEVNSVAFSPDAKRFVTGGGAGSAGISAKVWDAHTGAPLLEIRGNTLYSVMSVAFSPDGTRIATGSSDSTAKIWDARTGTLLFDLRGHIGFVDSVAFSPDGARLITGSRDKTAKVWDVRADGSLLLLQGHAGTVESVVYSPDGTRLATGSFDKTAKIWDARTGTLLLDLKGHSELVCSVAFSPDGTRLATGSFDKTAKIWDTRTGTPLLDLKGLTATVTSLAFSPDGSWLATCSGDKTAKIWDARTGTPLLDLKGHTANVNCVAFSSDGTRLGTGSFDRTAKIWDARTGTPLLDLKGHTANVNCVAFSSDGTRFVTGSMDQMAKVWDARTGTLLLELKGHRYGVRDVAFSPDGTRLVTCGGDMTAKIWDARTGTPLLDLKGHAAPVNCVAFSPDGRRIVTGSNDGTAIVFEARPSTPLIELRGHTDSVSRVAFSPDGRRLVTAGKDQTAKVWDARTGTPLLDLKGHTAPVTCVAFSPDGTRLGTGSGDQTARIWDAITGKQLLELKGHTSLGVCSLAFSPDGKRLVTGGYDKTALVWDAGTGQQLLELRGHPFIVNHVAFSPDGTRIVTIANLSSNKAGTLFGSVDREKATKVWDSKTGQELPEKPQWLDLPSLVTSPDGRYFAYRDDNRVWINDLVLSPEEREYRIFRTRPRPDLHREEYSKAMKAKDYFAARIHVDRLFALDPRDAQAHVNLGTILQQNKDMDGAIAEYRLAIEIDRKLIEAHKSLANALVDKNDLGGAIVVYCQVLTLDPKENQIASYLVGKRLTQAAARLYVAAFGDNPKLADDLITRHRYDGARYAALAGSSQGKDAESLEDKERSRWRKQALDWLRADLAAYTKLVENGTLADRTFVKLSLSRSQKDADLAGIRKQAALTKLSAEEREACQKFWADVETLLKKTQ